MPGSWEPARGGKKWQSLHGARTNCGNIARTVGERAILTSSSIPYAFIELLECIRFRRIVTVLSHLE